MPSQKMRLEAEMKDNASPAVRKLREELSNLQAASADTRGVAKLNAEIAKLSNEATADASPAVRKLRAELADLQKSTAENRAVQALTKEIGALKKMSGEVQATAGMKAFGSWFGEAKGAASGVMGVVGGLPSILGAIGIGGIAAGASVASMASEMKRLGEAALDMKELSRETGISLDFINRWSHAGEHFAVGADAMKGALDGFASQLPDFDRGIGNLFKEFSLWPDLVRKMRGESPAEALLDALRQAEEVGRTKGPQVQKQILDNIFPGHGAEAERLFGDGGLKGLLDQLQKPWAGPSPDFLKSAQQLRDATSDFNNALQGFENTYGPQFLKTLSEIVKDASDFFKVWSGQDHTPTDKNSSVGKVAADAWRKSDESVARSGLPLWLRDPFYWFDGNSEASKPGNAPMTTRGMPQALMHKSAYDGAGFGGLLQNASYTSGGTGSGTMQGAIAEGSKSGVLAALREMAIENGLKDGGAGGGGVGADSGSDGDGAGGGHVGGRRGFSSRLGGPNGDGGKSFNGNAGVGHWWTADRVKHAVDRLMKEGGLSQAGAEGLVSRWATVEAAGGPTSVNKASGAAGIGQWLGSRKHGFTEDFDSQLSHAIEEGKTTESRAWNRLKTAQNAREGAVGASMYERAEGYNAHSGVDNWTSKSEAGSAGIRSLLKGGDVANGAGDAPMSADVRQRLQEAKKHAFLGINQECVSLARAFSNTAETVFDWRRGDNAQDGKLKPGTPIATFLDRAGRASDRYAGGGTGTRGANRDHAAIFEAYTSQNGRRGMMVLEQSKGRPIHERFYPFGEGVGEQNGSNYAAIKSARTGTYLGENNPMNRRADSPAVAAAPQAHRRADADLSRDRRSSSESGSEHSLTVDIRDPGGHVKSTRLKSQGPMRVEMRNRWKTGQSPLVQA